MNNKSNYQAWDILPLSSTVSHEELLWHLIGWGILAASSHNVQPWRFAVNTAKKQIDIRMEQAGILRASDKDGRQAHISIGCALENILTAAECYGIPYVVDYHGTASFPSIALVTLAGDLSPKVKDCPFFTAMKNRRMNRGKYDLLRPLPGSIINSINDVIKKDELSLSLISDAPTRLAIAELQYTADRAVVARTEFRHELSDFLLPNNTSAGTGMPGSTFGLSDKMAQKIHDELRGKGAFDPDLAIGFASSSRDGIRSSPLIGVISADSDSIELRIKAGQAIQKIALLAELNGLSIALHAAIIEVGMFTNILKLRLRQPKRPLVLFRMGYATNQYPHSPRLNINEVLQ